MGASSLSHMRTNQLPTSFCLGQIRRLLGLDVMNLLWWELQTCYSMVHLSFRLTFCFVLVSNNKITNEVILKFHLSIWQLSCLSLSCLYGLNQWFTPLGHGFEICISNVVIKNMTTFFLFISHFSFSKTFFSLALSVQSLFKIACGTWNTVSIMWKSERKFWWMCGISLVFDGEACFLAMRWTLVNLLKQSW